MYLKIVGYFFLIVLVSLLEVGFFSHLPFGLFRLHILPLAIIFAYLLGNLRLAGWWALGGGVFLELFSFEGFGWHIMALCVVTALVWFLFEKVTTNRSLYSIAFVSAASALIYDLIFLGQAIVQGDVVPSFLNGLLGECLGLFYTVILALAIFYISNAVSRRLHPAFLSSSQRSPYV